MAVFEISLFEHDAETVVCVVAAIGLPGRTTGFFVPEFNTIQNTWDTPVRNEFHDRVAVRCVLHRTRGAE